MMKEKGREGVGSQLLMERKAGGDKNEKAREKEETARDSVRDKGRGREQLKGKYKR